MTPAEQIAWHRSEANRIEAEERARRPAFEAGQVWEDQHGCRYVTFVHVTERERAVDMGLMAVRIAGMPKVMVDIGPREQLSWIYIGTSDELRVVPPDPPAPQVAPEPTGAELVGRLCWVSYMEGIWHGPAVIAEFDGTSLPYCTADRIPGHGWWFTRAKPYVEGVEP